MNFLLLKSLLFIMGTQSCVGISFVFGPSHLTVTVGQTATLRCRVRNKGSFSVHWRNANQQRYLTEDTTFYPSAVNPRYAVVGNHAIGEYFLQITDAQVSDTGLYQCIIVPDGRTVTLAANLEVNSLRKPSPETPLCSSSPSPRMVNVGEQVTIFCNSPGGLPPARLTWLENGHVIAGPSSVHSLSHTFILEERHNGRTFTCRSMHQTFHGERRCTVVPFQTNPEARIEPPLFRGEVGGTAKFTCVAFGIPPELEYSWFFGDHPVNLWDGRFAITEGGSSLIIGNLTEMDHNSFVRCEISTVNGLTASSSGTLHVIQGTTKLPTVTLNMTYTKAYFTLFTETTTDFETPQVRGAATGKPRSLITVIVIAAIVITQIVFITLVYGIHRIANRMKKSGQLPSLETGVLKTSAKVADSCEITHIQSKGEPHPSTDDHRYKSLHRYDTANAVALALADEKASRDHHQKHIESLTYGSDMDSSVYRKIPSISIDYEIPKDPNNAGVEEYVFMRPSVSS